MADNPLNITADPTVINEWLAKAILDSTIGDTIRKAAVAKLGSYDFEREVSTTVERMVLQAARDLVERDPEMKEKIAARVAEELTPELISKLAIAAVAKLDRNY